ncbi:MAG: hypothetical protein M3179_06315 [Actinomycetota bacterium]|nr:hypothetical protein [Actinomycetota bacterium]
MHEHTRGCRPADRRGGLRCGRSGRSSSDASAASAITSAGPLTNIEISETLNCSVNDTSDAAGEFFGDIACGTFVAVGGNIYGPPTIPAGSNLTDLETYVDFTPVSQTPVTGSGAG